MDIKSIKLIYSEKYNQFYKPMRIDEDVGIVYIQVTTNRHDKTIKKNEILHMEENTEYKFVVMYTSDITAEQHFLEVMDNDNCSPHIKLNEINDFKKNMLDKSESCINKLKALSEINTVKSNEYACKIKNKALCQYRKFLECNNVGNNKKTYENQIIPKEIIKLALSKRLFIERRDDYCYESKNTYKRKVAPNQVKKNIQSKFPCGFLVRNKGGYIIAGKNDSYKYTLSVQEVIDFVNDYKPSNKRYRVLYEVPMSLTKEKQLKNCQLILKKYGLHLKNEHNYFFWVLDERKNVVAGGKNGFGFKYLLKYCRRLRSQPKKSVTDKIQTSD